MNQFILVLPLKLKGGDKPTFTPYFNNFSFHSSDEFGKF